MQRQKQHIDRPFLIITVILVLLGFFVFSSASLGLLTRSGAHFSDVAFSQVVLGILGGFIALTILAHVDYRRYRVYTPYFFCASLILTVLVFVPGIGLEANGARRWLDIFGFSLQPVELLKLAFILALAWYYSVTFRRIDDIRVAMGGFLVALFASGAVLLFQPDTGNFLLLAITGGAMLVIAGARFAHLAIAAVVFLCLIAILIFTRPYLLDRVTVFLDPSQDPTGSGYQIRQSLIAVGSGGIVGRGYGQSVQKFNYLPEPIGDSIFSVYAEEFGFIGGVIFLILFLSFAVRGMIIATRAPDRYGGLVVAGIVILIVVQSIMNIASMLALMPLTGEPLVFVSHGGTSLCIALASVGIILNVSRYGTVSKQIKS